MLVEVSAEFYFVRDNIEYVAFPTGWQENGCDMFDIVTRDGMDFVGSFLLSPTEDVVKGFNRWYSMPR